MKPPKSHSLLATGVAALCALASAAEAAPFISRLTPPSALFSFGDANPPLISRFLPDQRFDLQCTVQPDAGKAITAVEFLVDGKLVSGTVALTTTGLLPAFPAGTTVATLRAYSSKKSGIHTLTAKATQDDGSTVEAKGNFEVVRIPNGGKVDNVIIMIGDGLGAAHRTAARIMSRGVAMGKANAPLHMDTFPVTGMVQTSSLNSIITDSSPGAACYSTGNKSNNNQHGVFPDDTIANFDNPRVELISEYMGRKHGSALGIVTTSDVFDATPGAFGSHTQSRGAGTGICDQFLDEGAAKMNLRVLLGGGRKWFLPNDPVNFPNNGSARTAATDYVLPADLADGWGVAAGALDPERDLLADFQATGFQYAPDRTTLMANAAGATKLLGLFSLSNMNVAKDKIDGRRGNPAVVAQYGFPDQPMLDEMTDAALKVLSKNKKGFVLMVEGASIDKQAHNMDTERWILDTIEFDKAVGVAQEFARKNKNTLVIITADHECAGAAIIGASTKTHAELQARAGSGPGTDVNGNGTLDAGDTPGLRLDLVGVYEAAGFPQYEIAQDGYPATTEVDHRLLIGYGANSDRYEDWQVNPLPLRDSQQPAIVNQAANPASPLARDVETGFLVTGQVPGSSAVHTASDIPLSAYGRGAQYFTGHFDNTEVFFKIMRVVGSK